MEWDSSNNLETCSFYRKISWNRYLCEKPEDGITALDGRALLVFHGTEDTRVPFLHSERLVAHAKSIKQDLKFVKNIGSDHNEALLIEPKIIQENLIDFYEKSLK